MATNTYSYGSLGERFGVGNATTKSSLDLSRIKNDANRWTLQQLVTDPDNDANFALNVASVTGGTISGTTGTFSSTLAVTGVSTLTGRVGVGGSTITDSHLVNIQGSTASDNVGVVLNKTNSTAQIWAINNTGTLNFHNQTTSLTPLQITSNNETTFKPSSSNGNLVVKVGSINSDSIRLEAGGTTSTYLEYRGYLGHSWYVDSTRKATLDATGLGLGVDSPDTLLHVQSSTASDLIKVSGTGTDSNPNIQIANDARSYNLQVVGARSDAFEIWDRTAGATRFSISTSGTAFFYGAEASFGTDTNNRGIVNYGSNVLALSTVQSGTTYYDTVKITNGKMGVGVSPECRVHIRESTLSGFTPNSNTNLAVEENSTSLIEIAGVDSGILFSDASDWAGRIFYTHSTEQMAFATAQTNRLYIDQYGLNINGVANGNSAFKVTNAAGAKTSEFEIDGSGNGAMKVRNSSGIEKISLSSYEDSHISAGFQMGFGTLSPVGLVDIAAAGRNAAGDISDVDDYALIIRCSSTTNEGNGIGFTNDTADVIGGAIIHQDKGSANTGDLVFYTRDTVAAPNASVLEAMRITNTQRIGIGTDAPTTQLELYSTTGPEITITRNDTLIAQDDVVGGIRFASNDTSTALGSPPHYGAGIKAVAEGTVGFQVLKLYAGQDNLGYENDTPNMALWPSGDVFFYNTTPGRGMAWDASASSLGIGTEAPGAPLEIVSSTTNGNALFLASAASGTEGSTIRAKGSYTVADGADITFNISGNGVMILVSDNNTGDGAMFYATYKSATVTLIADPNGQYATTPTSAKTSLFKSANSLTVSLSNDTGGSRSYTILKITASD